jgi:DedD protein
MANKDDLLNLNNNKKNIKKPLIYGAIAFLIFIIAILGFAIYNNASSKQDNVVLPPQIKQEKQQESMFKEVPIEEDNNSVQKNTDEGNLADKLAKNGNNSETNKAPAPAVQETQKPAQPVQTNSKTQEQSVIEKTKNPVKAEKPVKHVKRTVTDKKYYVQVAALMKYKKPNRKFLEIIKKEGYSYRLYRTYYIKNGKKIDVTKILIGPFDKNTVKKELSKIKNTITQNAFIYKVR